MIHFIFSRITVNTLSITLCLLILCFLASYSILFREASAHIIKKFGNIQLQVGWSDEPPLTGQLNNVIVDVNQTSGKTQTPIINALSDMNILVKYGGVTKALDFLPSPTTDGLYLGQIIPTRIGSYYLVLNGTVQGQKISSQLPLDLVESSQKLAFPDQSGLDGATVGGSSTATPNNLGPQLQGIVSQLANQIDSVKGITGAVAKSNAETLKSIQDVKNSADSAYMIGMVGIGAGVAGIIIAAIALSRRGVMVAQ